MRKNILCALAVLLLYNGTTLPCWSNKMYEIITMRALVLMPKSLRRVMLLHKPELIEGAMESASMKNSEDHYLYTNKKYGKADFRIDLLSNKIVYDIDHHVPFSVITREFGTLAHYVSDLNNPLHASKKDITAVRCEKEFNRYMELNLEKFPFVFYGYNSQYLAKNDIKAFSYSIVDRSSKLHDIIINSLYNGGHIKPAESFDEKSLIFGSAAITYQHSISNVAQLWLYIWKRAHGDVTGLDQRW